MRTVTLGWLSGVAVAASGCVANPAFGGPLPVRNQHPAQLTVLHMPPASAEVLRPGAMTARLDAAYSSLFLSGQDTTKSWIMDGEYLRAAPGARFGLGHGLEFGFEIPVAHTSGGFLDSFVIDYHERFGFPDQGRDAYPQDEYSIQASDQGSIVWEVERDGFELLDIPLQLTLQVLPAGPQRLGVAVRTAVELPTGDDDRGYGSGELDASLGAVCEYRTASVALYGHAQYTFAGTPPATRRAGLTFADVTSLGVGAELPLFPDLHLLLQVEWETSTLREFGLEVTGRDQVLLWGGARWQVARQFGVELGIGEDLQGLASPDFTAWLGMVLGFGSGASP